MRCEFHLQHIQYLYGARGPTGSSPAPLQCIGEWSWAAWRWAHRVQGQPRTMQPKEKLSNLMWLHDFSAITALMLAPAHAAKSSSLNGAVTSLARCSKVASKHARGHVNACKDGDVIAFRVDICLPDVPVHPCGSSCTLTLHLWWSNSDAETIPLVLGRDIWFPSIFTAEQPAAEPWPPPLEYAAL